MFILDVHQAVHSSSVNTHIKKSSASSLVLPKHPYSWTFRRRTIGREREGLRWIREEKARENRGIRGSKGPVMCK